MQRRPTHILPVIVASQFAGTSLWFAGNAVLPDLQTAWNLEPAALGNVTSAVQFGFILGTLVFAVTALSDQFSPRRVFLVCTILAAMANAGAVVLDNSFGGLLSLRFLVGFFLAGIYPIGMKIAAGWFLADLGKALGFLVGALVAGTALPHLLRGMSQAVHWETVMISVSAFASLGGLLMFLAVPDGPHLKSGARFDPRALAAVFSSRRFRASAFGYFGHMWELYAFWAFAPALVTAYAHYHGLSLNISLWAFAIIGVGGLSCALGGIASLRLGSAKVAGGQLLTSGLCCLASPLLFFAPMPVFLLFMLIWGLAVVGDSPQFSALNAQSAPPERVGSALTIANAIGFAISIVSIELLNALAGVIPMQYLFILLTPGPVFGLLALRRLR